MIDAVKDADAELPVELVGVDETEGVGVPVAVDEGVGVGVPDREGVEESVDELDGTDEDKPERVGVGVGVGVGDVDPESDRVCDGDIVALPALELLG